MPRGCVLTSPGSARGNFLRHEYDRIEGERLWFMVERDLVGLF
jgi:hypothetical protein